MVSAPGARSWDVVAELARARDAARGDEPTLRSLIEELKPLTWRRAWALARPDRHHAEDLAQEGFLWALRPGTLNAYEGSSPLLGYLAVVAHRQMIGVMRSGRERAWAARTEYVQDPVGDDEDPTFNDAQLRYDGRRLEAAVTALAPELALLVRLKASGVPNSEIAELLGAPIGTVKSRFARVCRHLRSQLEGTSP